MRQFFKIVLGSCLGVVLAGIVMIFVVGGSIGALVAQFSGESESKELKPNTVLKIQISDLTPERTNNTSESSVFNFDTEDVLGIHDITKLIKHAKTDKNVSGLFLDLDDNSLPLAKTSLLTNAIADFKSSDKFIYAYGSSISQNDLLLASHADKTFVNPLGDVNFVGYGASIMYMKDLFDRLGIDWQVFYAGNFKSASEPYRLNEMSENNRKQVTAYLSDIWDAYLSEIADNRGLEKATLAALANTLEIRKPENAKKHGLIDEVGYYGDAIDEIKEGLGLDADASFNTTTLSNYSKNADLSKYKKGDKVAVIYAEGTILSGDTDNGTISDFHYVPIIRKLRFDDDVKAIVLRVNSPGGSALASENILEELKRTHDRDIPIVVSMGGVAASGGYYISCAADSIFAEPFTITGSIGVVAQIPTFQKFFNEKLGIHIDTVQVAKYAIDSRSVAQPFSKDASQFYQENVDELYQRFISHVAKARNMSVKQVDEIAQGRVWSAEDALEINLVDRIGSLNDAINSAKILADLDENTGIVEYPKVKNKIEQIVENITKNGAKLTAGDILENELGESYQIYKHIKKVGSIDGPMYMMPYSIDLH